MAYRAYRDQGCAQPQWEQVGVMLASLHRARYRVLSPAAVD